MADELRVGGFVPFTTVDYPDRLSAVVFCQGCPWRCRYCHNPHLQPWQADVRWRWDEILEELAERRGFLEAVVFSGGEPTAQAGLKGAIHTVRALGYAIGLHTAGIYPARLAAVLPLVDWVGLDIKAPLDQRYGRITGCPSSESAAAQSLELVLLSGVAVQIRTTVHPTLLSDDDLRDMQNELARRGGGPVHIQPFRPDGCTDLSLLASPDFPHGQR